MSAGEQPAHTRVRILSLRALASVLAAIGFAVMLASGLVLFFAPAGRISRIDEWNFAGLLRHDWMAIHLGFAFLFIVAGAVHLCFNWRPMRHYLATKRPAGLRIGREVVVALVLSGLLATAAVQRWPPFDTILGIHKAAKSGFEPGALPGGSRRGPFRAPE